MGKIGDRVGAGTSILYVSPVPFEEIEAALSSQQKDWPVSRPVLS